MKNLFNIFSYELYRHILKNIETSFLFLNSRHTIIGEIPNKMTEKAVKKTLWKQSRPDSSMQ